MSSHEGYISPDYPGFARSTIENRLGGHAMFLPGCFGNVWPHVVRDGDFGFTTPGEVRDLGEQLALGVCRAAEFVRTEPADQLTTRTVDIEMPYGCALSVAELQAMSGDYSTLAAKKITGPWARNILKMIERNKMPATVRFQMQSLRIGSVLCINILGDPVQGNGPRHHEEGGYEPNVYPYYGHPATFDHEQ